MSRGGRRAGAPGKSYSNRTDLNQVRQPSPASVVQPPAQAPGPASARPTQPMGAPAGPGLILPPPGTLGHNMPPGTPITHGLSTGPGLGPEALPPMFKPDPIAQAVAAFNTIPQARQTPLMRAASATVANDTNPNYAGPTQ